MSDRTIDLRLIAGATVAVLLVGFGLYQCHGQRVVTTETAKADVQHQEATQQAAQGAEHDAKAETISPEIAALRAEVARLRRVAAPALAVDAPANALAPLVSAQDRVIASQDTYTAEVTAARDSWRASATASQAEATSLREVIDHTPKPYYRAIGAFKSSDGSVGITGEYDIQRVRVGVDLAFNGQQKFATTVRALWRF